MRRLLDLFGTWGIAVLLMAAGLAVAWRFVDPAPPRSLTLATGDADGAYHAYGLRYQALLARQGIEVRLVETAGAPENLALLKDPEAGVDLGFLQSGLAGADDEGLLALASLYFEPFWLFAARSEKPLLIEDLRGRRISAGDPGSGTRAVIGQLMRANELSAEGITLVDADPDDLPGLLAAGSLDVAALVAGPESPAVRALAESEGIELLEIERAPAYARRYPFLTTLDLPRGSLDIPRDIPAVNTTLLATTASLAAREDLHPALVDLILMAAREIHGPPGLFSARDEFPSPDYLSLPLSPDADRHFKYGVPFLMRHLPFWAATGIDRLKVMILPVLGLMIPLAKIMPPLLRWRTRRRIFRWYKEVRSLDPDLAQPASAAAAAAALEEIERIEGEIAREDVPLSYADELYQLRTHLELVRIKLRRIAGMSADAAAWTTSAANDGQR
jgi:TRAP transporter TAXI family solute receptor